MKAIIEQLREAHEAACKVFGILSEVSEQLRASSDVVDDDVEEQIVDLTEVADELQASLFDLIEND